MTQPTRSTRTSSAKIFAIAILVALAIPARSAVAQRIVVFDAPGADRTANSYGGTYPSAINIDGTTVGELLTTSKAYKGFLRDASGHFTEFSAPGADETPGSFNGTAPSAINDLGAVTGSFSDKNGYDHGFIRQPDGSFITFDVPDAGGYGTLPQSINLDGAVAGFYTNSSLNFRAFIRKPDGKFVTFAGPDACTTAPSKGCYGSALFSIDVFGLAAGSFVDRSLVGHGMVRYANGDVAQFDAPGAGTSPGQGTGCPGCATGLNVWGDIAGSYYDANNVSHGFIRKGDGSILTFDVPKAGTAQYQGTGCPSDCAVEINDLGAVTGTFIDASDNFFGYIRTPEGKFETLNPKDSIFTQPVWINDEGIVLGQYLDSNLVYHGFLAYPD